MPFLIALIIRVVLFLAGMVPLLRWVIRRARSAGEIPTDHQLNSDIEAARGGGTRRPQHFFGRPIHERVENPGG